MDDRKNIPLAERIRGAASCGSGIPLAMGLSAYDFLGVAGEITGQEERYEKLYQTHIAPHDSTDGAGKRVCDLVVEADTMEPKERANLLFWLLVEPFANMDMERRQES